MKFASEKRLIIHLKRYQTCTYISDKQQFKIFATLSNFVNHCRQTYCMDERRKCRQVQYEFSRAVNLNFE